MSTEWLDVKDATHALQPSIEPLARSRVPPRSASASRSPPTMSATTSRVVALVKSDLSAALAALAFILANSQLVWEPGRITLQRQREDVWRNADGRGVSRKACDSREGDTMQSASTRRLKAARS